MKTADKRLSGLSLKNHLRIATDPSSTPEQLRHTCLKLLGHIEYLERRSIKDIKCYYPIDSPVTSNGIKDRSPHAAIHRRYTPS